MKVSANSRQAVVSSIVEVLPALAVVIDAAVIYLATDFAAFCTKYNVNVVLIDPSAGLPQALAR